MTRRQYRPVKQTCRLLFLELVDCRLRHLSMDGSSNLRSCWQHECCGAPASNARAAGKGYASTHNLSDVSLERWNTTYLFLLCVLMQRHRQAAGLARTTLALT